MRTNETLGTWRQAVATWFWTNAGATLIGLAFAVLFIASDSNYRGGLPVKEVGTVVLAGALLSLPIVPVAYYVFRYILALPSRGLRICSTLLAVTVFMGLATLLLHFTTQGVMDYASAVILLVYLPASLVAHAVVYRHELFRSDTGA